MTFLTLFLLSSPLSPSRVCAASPVHLQTRGHHCHLHVCGPRGTPSPDHMAEERADPGDQRPHQAEEQQQVRPALGSGAAVGRGVGEMLDCLLHSRELM